MKKATFFLVGLLLGTYPAFIQSQGRPQPFVISPFIGDKLDRVEEEYFKIFPTLTDFQEGIFYINPDSSLNVKIKAKLNNVPIDTTILCDNSLSYLIDKINQRILTDISQNKVKKLKFTTITDSIFEGTVYSYENRKIGFIKNRFIGADEDNNQEDYLQKLNYFHLNTITIQQKGTYLASITGTLGFVAGGIIALLITPESTEPKDSWFNFDALNFLCGVKTFLIGGAIGGVTGFLIGLPIEYPVDYNTIDPEAENILYENALLKK